MLRFGGGLHLAGGQIIVEAELDTGAATRRLRSTVTDPLTDDEMAAIAECDRNSRLIKGQVFLWKEGQTWEDLWDLDGTIAQ